MRRSRSPRWTGEDPHDRLEVEGVTARLQGRLNHRPYRDLAHHVAKINAYTDVMARGRVEAGERPSLARMVLRPLGRWCRVFVLQGGVLDGARGFVVATMAAYYVFLKYAKIWDIARRDAAEG